MSIKCPCCGSDRVSAETRFQGEHSDLRFEERGAFFSATFFSANRGRACLACGHVMLFLHEDDLAKLNRMADKLEPVV